MNFVQHTVVNQEKAENYDTYIKPVNNIQPKTKRII